ncbi:ketopantoate reductase family protein [Erwinia sp. SLM-02]|uniref:ketopantoate reductase family protein n=1 Tax=Erwinia sp. SLM-02 TaxID=3020057 RepID=UPI003080093B
MRILIVGAGATGGYFGARLAQAGRDVTFLLRERRRQQLEKDGLILETPQGRNTLWPVTLLARDIKTPYDLIVLTVKGFGLNQAMEDIAPAVGPDTLILPILNGMRHIDLLRQRFGDRHVIGGLCKIHATLGPEGEIVQLSPLHQLYYGALNGDNGEALQRLDATLRRCGFDAFLSEDIACELWEKWLLLSTLGAVTCLARGDTRQVIASGGGQAMLSGLFQEVLSTLVAEGYPHRQAQADGILTWLSNPETPLTSSMYRDLMQGYDIEAEQIIGDLVERAERHRLAIPLLNAVWVNLQVYQLQRQTSSSTQ